MRSVSVPPEESDGNDTRRGGSAERSSNAGVGLARVRPERIPAASHHRRTDSSLLHGTGPAAPTAMIDDLPPLIPARWRWSFLGDPVPQLVRPGASHRLCHRIMLFLGQPAAGDLVGAVGPTHY